MANVDSYLLCLGIIDVSYMHTAGKGSRPPGAFAELHPNAPYIHACRPSK